MAELIWTESALEDLAAIADYIALENTEAAKSLVQRIFAHVALLKQHPELGSRPPEIRRLRYRQIVEPPCRVFYHYEEPRVFILHVMHGEMRFRKSRLIQREQKARKKIDQK